MKPGRKYAVVLVTAPDLKTARALVSVALKARLVACGNIISRIESHYWWQGRIETGREALILMKTTVASIPALEKLILEHHAYDTPEIIALPLSQGTPGYLNWITASLRQK